MDRSIHVKPNEKGYITVKFNTASKSGLIVENVDVISNDGQRPEITLTIRANVWDVNMPFFPK